MRRSLKQVSKFAFAVLAGAFILYVSQANAGWFDDIKNKANSLMVGGLWDSIDPTLLNCMEGKLEL